MKSSSLFSRIFVLCLLGFLALSALILACIYWNIYGYAKLFGDFDVFRLAAKHVMEHDLRAVYATQHIQRLLDIGPLTDFSFYLNPPTGLLLLYPLGFLNVLNGLVLWSFIQIALLLFVLRDHYFKKLLATHAFRPIHRFLLLSVTFLAFGLQNILYGQMAGFCAVLFLCVLCWRKTHPVWAGIMLGVFSIKPQLGLLLPLLLLAERNWRTLLWAVIVALCMALLSYLLWGEVLWQDYANMLIIRSRFLASDQPLLFIMSTSIYAALRNLSMTATAAFICQSAIAIAVLLYIWPIFRNGKEMYKILILITATYLVTPYSLIYDMVLLALPCALLLRRAETNCATRSELIALLLLVLMPLVSILLQIQHIPYSVIAIGFTFIVATRFAKSDLTA